MDGWMDFTLTNCSASNVTSHLHTLLWVVPVQMIPEKLAGPMGRVHFAL